MRRRRSGISAVVGTAIAIMIFFTVIIPMWIYMQNVQTLFMDEVSRRLRFEIEKVNENVEVTASLQPPDLNPFGYRGVVVTLRNKSPVEVVVPAVYIESSRAGLQKIENQYKLAPGEVIANRTIYYIGEPDEVVIVRVPTLRGNSFTSNAIGPKNLPYMLIVQLNNASFGYEYRIKVDAGPVGCVIHRSDLYTEGCEGSAETRKFVSSPDDLNIIAGFNVAPGVYSVKAVRCENGENEPCMDGSEPVSVSVNSHTVVELVASRRIEIRTPLPLRVMPLLQNYTFVASNNTDNVMVSVPFLVSLGNNTEPLFNIKVNIEVLNAENLTANLYPQTSSSITVSRLSAGETYFGVALFSVEDIRIPGKLGGYFVYRISLVSAEGQVSNLTYSSTDFEVSTAEGTVILCRASSNGGSVTTYCIAP